MPRDLLGGFKRKPTNEVDEKTMSYQTGGGSGGPGATGTVRAPAAPAEAGSGMGSAPVGRFVNFDRMLGLNREKVQRSADATAQGAENKVGAANKAATTANDQYRASVGGGTNQYRPPELQRPAPQPAMQPGTATKTSPGLQSTPAPAPLLPNRIGRAALPTLGGVGNALEGQQTPAPRQVTATRGGPSWGLGSTPEAPRTRDELVAASQRGYTGLDNLSEVAGFGDALSSAGAADRTLGNLGSGAGLATELGYTTPAGGALSGNASLDAGLLQGASGGRLAALGKRYGNLTKGLGDAVAASREASDLGRRTSDVAKARYGQDLGQFDQDVASAAAETASRQKATDDAGAAAQQADRDAKLDFEAGSLAASDDETLRGLGSTWKLSNDGNLRERGYTQESISAAYRNLTKAEKTELMKRASGSGGNYWTIVMDYLDGKKG